MNDLISRQGVLDFIDDCLNHADKLQRIEQETLLAMRRFIIHQPSIDKCDKCRFVFYEKPKPEQEEGEQE